MERLKREGHEVYLVGGCVRDMLLGVPPKDWDMATSASVSDTIPLLRDFRVIPAGLKHGTVSVLSHERTYEITTLRTPMNERECRPSILLDLKARDFTVNAMAYNPEDGLIDPFNGETDLERGIIRAVENPDNRFKEDPLRLMRAVRFSSGLGFEIETETRRAVKRNANLLKNVSEERIRDEFNRIIVGDIAFVRELVALDLLKQFVPEFTPLIGCGQNNPHHYVDVGEHTFLSMEKIEPDLLLRLAMFLHDIGKPASKSTDTNGIDHFYGHPVLSAELAGKILKRLRYSSDFQKRIGTLGSHHEMKNGLTKKSVKKAILKLGKENFPLLLKVKTADALSQSLLYVDEKLEYIKRIRRLFHEITEADEALTRTDLRIDGDELIAMGFKPGREIGEALEFLLKAVLEDPNNNSRERLSEIAALMLKKKRQ